jgi:hypothetical protein
MIDSIQVMATEHIVALLIAERDRLSRAIDALQGPTKRRGRPPKSESAAPASAPSAAAKPARKKRRKLSAAEKKAASERMKAFWAARRKAKGKG